MNSLTDSSGNNSTDNMKLENVIITINSDKKKNTQNHRKNHRHKGRFPDSTHFIGRSNYDDNNDDDDIEDLSEDLALGSEPSDTDSQITASKKIL